MVENSLWNRPKANEIPLKYWNPLQKVSPSKGRRKGVYTGYGTQIESKKRSESHILYGQSSTVSMEEHAKESDLLICEGMYGEPEKDAKARRIQAYDDERGGKTHEKKHR